MVANADGAISVDMLKDLNGQPKKFFEYKPMVFQEVDGQDRIAFVRDGSGRLVMGVDELPFMAFQKARWYQNSTFNTVIIVGTMVVFLLTLLLWPITALTRRHYGHMLTLEAPERRRRLLVRGVCILDVVFLAGFLINFTLGMNDISLLSSRYNGLLPAIQFVGWLGLIGTLVVLYKTCCAPGARRNAGSGAKSAIR